MDHLPHKATQLTRSPFGPLSPSESESTKYVLLQFSWKFLPTDFSPCGYRVGPGHVHTCPLLNQFALKNFFRVQPYWIYLLASLLSDSLVGEKEPKFIAQRLACQRQALACYHLPTQLLQPPCLNVPVCT